MTKTKGEISEKIQEGKAVVVTADEIPNYTTATDDIFAPVVDYSEAYSQMKLDILGEVSHAKWKRGRITIQGKEVSAASLSSYLV